jgi:hypothetical protein
MFVDQAGALWLTESIGLLLALAVCLAIGLIHVSFDTRRHRPAVKQAVAPSPRQATAPASLERYRRIRRAAPPLGPFAA